MPRDLLAETGPRDLLAGTEPPEPPQEDTVLSRVGDFIVRATGGGGGDAESIRAGNQRWQDDALVDEGVLDRLGSLFGRGVARAEQGLLDTFAGATGSKEAAARAAALNEAFTPVAGQTEWDAVKASPSAGGLGRFILETGIESAPTMLAAAVPYVGLPTVAGSMTGNVGRERAANNGRDAPTGGDLLEAAPFAVASAALERIGVRGIGAPGGTNALTRIGQAAAREGLTETVQSGLEYSGGTVGTEAGFDMLTALDQMAAGGVAGAGIGGGLRTGAEIASPVTSQFGRRSGGQQPAGQIEPEWEGSLDDLLAPEQSAPRDLLALPAPVAYADSQGATAIGSEGLAQLDRTSAARRIEAGRPEPQTDPIADFMRRARRAESSGNDSAKNPRSSATGRYQFIDSTWISTYKDEFGDTGETDAQILAKRKSGKMQDRLMKRLTDSNAAGLRAAGIPVTTGNLYLAHFAGIAGARALHQNPNASAESVLGSKVIKANPFLRGKTAADAIAWAAGKMGQSGGSIGGTTGIDVPDITIPGADGSLLNRGDRQGQIANIEIPDLTPGQRGAGQATPIEIGQPEQGAQRQAQGTPAIPDLASGRVAPSAPALPDLAPARSVGATSQVTAPRIGPVDTQFELRDLSELTDSASPNYDRSLQPRDRAGRATSAAQITSIANNLDPAQLGESRLASTGAPIIGPDGQVESGNGRISALAQAYATQPERIAAYRQMITGMGLDPTGMERPVLVRRRTTAMTPEQRQAWTRAANERDTMAMSSTEQAAADAASIDDGLLRLYRGGPITAAGNRDFVRGFISKAVAPAEQNAMTAADGAISADGVRRIRFALLARAYGDTELISRISEDTDTNIAAIGKALLDAAPAFARLKAKIAAGEVPAQYDISENIAEAARMVSRSRDTGQSLQGMLAQTDAFAPRVPPETEQVLYLFYRDAELRKPRSGTKVTDALIDYVDRAEVVGANLDQGVDMFGNAPDIPSPAILLQQVRGALDGDAGSQRDLLAPPESATVAPDEQANRPDGQPAAARPDRGEQDGGSRSTVPTLARGQLRALGIAQELRTEKAATLVGRTASTPKELAEIAQVYRDPRYETFRIFYTKGDTIVHATGVSSRSVSEAPIMPADMASSSFYGDMRATMERSGADGYYLLHNHPSGEPDPSQADKDVTRNIARKVPGFRAHVVINSNKYARIIMDAAGRTKSNVASLDAGVDRLITASVPNEVLGRSVTSTSKLAVIAKELQKPGYITVIGGSADGQVRVVVDYPADTTKKDAKKLMAMARRIQRQSGSQQLFLVGDKAVLESPVVSRAIRAGLVTAAVSDEGQLVDVRTKAEQRKPSKMPQSPARYVAEQGSDFDPTPDIQSKLVDKDGITRDIDAIKKVVGSPLETLGRIVNGGMADNFRALFYTMDSRMRVLADRYDSEAINQLADQFHARAGKVDKAIGETYHEAVDREGFGRAGKVWRILEPFAGNKAAMDRIGLMLRNPGQRTSARKAEAEAARDIAKLLKDTIEYRKAAGEEIGEVTDGYFPRMMDVEKAMSQRGLFLRQATELYKRHGAENPKASAEAWLARLFDQYAGLDGGPDFIDLFHDTRPAGVGRKTSKSREFGKDADVLLADFYDNDTGQVLTAYMIGAAKKAEEARRFGGEKLARTMNRIKADIRKSGEDAGDTLDSIARMVAVNLGRSETISERARGLTSVLHTASQLGTLDRATITSLSEAMMGFVRAGPKYGLPMVTNSLREFARQIRNAPPSESAQMAEALGIATDALVGEALAARAGFERSNTTRRAQKVQQGFFGATGLHQWTEGTRTAATRMGQHFISDLAREAQGRGRKAERAAEYLRELGVKDPAAFAKWLGNGGTPGIDQITGADASAEAQAYRTALVRFVNQTIMKPTRAQKPRWASHPVGSLFFALMSFSYGFKKNVLDRTGRMGVRAIKDKDPTLLYPAFGLAGLFAAHTVIQTAREAILGGGREDDEEGFQILDLVEAMDRAGLFGAASPLLNAVFGLKYRRGIAESLMGPTVGRPADLITKTIAATGGEALGNSPNTNSAERAAAAAIFDVVLEPALEAYGVTRLKGPLAAAVVWGTGNREGGVMPADRDIFIDAVAGPKPE